MLVFIAFTSISWMFSIVFAAVIWQEQLFYSLIISKSCSNNTALTAKILLVKTSQQYCLLLDTIVYHADSVGRFAHCISTGHPFIQEPVTAIRDQLDFFAVRVHIAAVLSDVELKPSLTSSL